MATPQPPYPGPSNYYQHPPQPQYAYPGHPYPYQYPVQHMNGHPMHAPPSPRVSSPARGGYPSARGGGPTYHHHNFQPHPHYPYPYHPNVVPHHSHSPGPYPPPPQQHGKFAPPPPQGPPYSPSYAIHPSSPFTSGWTPQQTLSPLPKQLSLHHPVSPGPPPPTQPPTQEDSIPPLLSQRNDAEPNHNLRSPSPVPPSPSYSAARQSPLPSEQFEQQVEQPTDDPPAPSSPQPSSPRSTSALSASDLKFDGWVIWSKRPSDPSNAPGIIISPRARPPENVISGALDLPSPPPSPEPIHPPVRAKKASAMASNVVKADVSAVESVVTLFPSSSTTETTPGTSTAQTPVPGSPASSRTSVSGTAFSPTRGKALQSAPAEQPAAPIVSIPEEKPIETHQPETASEPEAAPQPEAASEPKPTPEAAEEAQEEPTKDTPAEAAVQPTPPLPKAKPSSWAALLRPSGAGGSSRSPNSLPTSSITGFSIPADALPATPVPVAAGKKNELLSLLSASPSGPPVPPRIRPRGLVNTGNMCFANVVLQVLVYCPPFWRLFTELGRLLELDAEKEREKEKGKQRREATKTPMIDATIRFLREFMPKKPVEGKGKGVERDREYYKQEEDEEEFYSSFVPTVVYDALKEKKQFDNMRGGHQEDAEEFLGFYLDTLEEELNVMSSALAPPARPPVQNGHAHPGEEASQEDGWLEVGKKQRPTITRTVKSTESPITRIFGGKFRSTLRVPHQKDSAVVEDWRSLRLDIQREQIATIKDALACISHPSSVQVTSVTKPGVTLDATQLVHVEALPPVLILHLKRFLYDANAGGVAKVCKHVSFGPELEIGSELMAPGRKVLTIRYKLFGALYHHGLSASGGHYTLDVLHPNIDMTSSTKPREGWVRIDDELVSDVRPEDVFGEQQAPDHRHAYLLFYRRVGGPVTRS